MIARVLKLSALLLVVGFATFVAGLVAAQRDFIYQRHGPSVLRDADALAIEGSTRVAIATADGETLAGWYLPPKDKDGKVFLFFHGNVGLLEAMKWRWQSIVEHGEGILAFSYRGFPGSTGSPSEAGLHEDARAAFAWLVQRHDRQRIILHGFSLGTGVAAKLATEVEARALILEAPYLSLTDLAASRHPYLPVSLLLWDQFPTRDFIGQVKAPLLIAHGEGDTVIPFSHAKTLHALAPEPKTFVPMAGSDHNTLVRDGLYEHIWRFLDGLKG